MRSELADEMAALNDTLGSIAFQLENISDALIDIADAFQDGKLYVSGVVATYEAQ